MNEAKNIQNTTERAVNYTDLLAAGFISKNEQKKFAKLLTYATIFQQDPEWEDGVYEMTKEYSEKQVQRMNIPDGWQSCGSYKILKQWFFQACR